MKKKTQTFFEKKTQTFFEKKKHKLFLKKQTQTFFEKKKHKLFLKKKTNFFLKKNQTFLGQTRGRTRLQLIIVQDGRREYCCALTKALILKEMI